MSISQNFPDEFPNLRLNFAQGKTLDPRVSFSRSSTATYVGPNGLIQTAGVNTPRFNYDPITGECKGLLVEESRTNYISYSSDLSNDYWRKSNVVVQSGFLAPDGTNTAYKLARPNGYSGWSYVYASNLGLSGTYTFSIFVKDAGAGFATFQNNPTFFFNTETFSYQQTGTYFIKYPNGWYRIIVPNSGQTTPLFGFYAVVPFTGDGNSGALFWGVQVEQGSFPTSYIPTTSSTVTRSADVAQITTTNLNNFYNSSGGTLLTTATPLSNTQNRTNLVTIGSATTNYPALISLLPGANGAQFRSTNSTIPQVDFAAVGSGSTRTIVCANFGNNNFTFNTNSNGLGTTSSGTIGTATTLTIGGTGYGTTETFNGTIENILYYPTPITNSQVTALSSTSGSVQLANNQFAFTVRIPSAGTTYTLLTNNSGSYNYNVSWGDGTVTNGITTNNPTKVYANAGVYTVIVTQNSGSFYFYNNGNSSNGPLVTGVVGNGSSFGWSNFLSYAWYGCSNLTSFPRINTSNVNDMTYGWYGCSSLTTFPALDTSNVTSLRNAWYGCSNLTSFPFINTSKVTDFSFAWNGCPLRSFPAIDTSSATNFANCFSGAQFTSFPVINTSNVTNFQGAWYGSKQLTSFPTIDTSNGTNFAGAWNTCVLLSSFPVLNLSKGTNFNSTWQYVALTSFPSITFGGAGNTSPIFSSAWFGSIYLSSFPTGAFNACTGSTNYTSAWTGCGLTSGSIENILTSIVSSGATINVPQKGNIGLNGGTNASFSTWTSPAITAYNTLVGAGWTISYNP